MNRLSIFFLLIIAPLLALFLAYLGFATAVTNPLGWFLLLTGAAYFLGVLYVVVIRHQRFWESHLGGGVTQQETGDCSFWLISLAMIAVFYLSPIEYLYFPPVFPRTTLAKITGVLLVILGTLLFVWARRTLGTSYSGHVSTEEGQDLVQAGPYRYIRHPAYAGYLLMALGISKGYSSLVGLLSVVIFLVPVIVYRISVEEKLLSRHFGAAYQDYARSVKRLLPEIW